MSDGTRAFILDASSLVPEPTVIGGLIAASCGLLVRKRQKRVR